jgi:hypothetical protein
LIPLTATPAAESGAYWLGVVGGLVLVSVVLEMVRRRYLRGRFALMWLGLGTLAAVLALFPQFLFDAAEVTGVEVPLNLLLFVGMILMSIMIMQLSSEVGRLSERTRILAEEIAFLRVNPSLRSASEKEQDCAPGTPPTS